MKKLLWQRSGGHYLFWLSAIYLIVGFTNIAYKFTEAEYIQIIWISALALPFTYPPLGRYFNLDIEWDRKMFNWFDKKPDYANVVKFPEPKAVPENPYIAPPEPEIPAKIFYRIGATDKNRVAFSMGHMEITMNKEGCQNMIAQLSVFMDQLYDEDNSPNDDPDGGESIPVPDQKAA
jgi:hypothetical protein